MNTNVLYMLAVFNANGIGDLRNKKTKELQTSQYYFFIEVFPWTICTT